jgi:hypothetical protein
VTAAGNPSIRAWQFTLLCKRLFLPLLLLNTIAAFPVLAAALGEQDKACLTCHSAGGLQKKLADGDQLSLKIEGGTFAESVHAGMGCIACHATIDTKAHPGAGRKIDSARSFSLAQTGACKSCHEDKFKQYEGSIHASLLRDGNPIAPVCTDCHAPHAVKPKAARLALKEIPCQKCHGSIFDAYAGSVHGVSRSKSDKSTAPICSDCHRAHDVSAASTSDQAKTACQGCHASVLRSHQEWLPNADTHLQVISCPACHSPSAKRRVDLRLFDNVSQQRVREKEGVPRFEMRARSADEKGQGLNALAVQSLLKQFNSDGNEGRTTLRGRLEVSDSAEIHQLAPKDKALSDCAVCHSAGGNAFQSVTVSIVGPDGRPLRYDAQKDVLNTVLSVDSVRGFYAIGSTRIKMLDWLLLLTVLGGVAVPIGHQTLRWLFRRYANKMREEEAAGNAASGASNQATDRK